MYMQLFGYPGFVDGEKFVGNAVTRFEHLLEGYTADDLIEFRPVWQKALLKNRHDVDGMKFVVMEAFRRLGASL